MLMFILLLAGEGELEIPLFSVDKLSSWTNSENLGGQFANFLLVEIHMFPCEHGRLHNFFNSF